MKTYRRIILLVTGLIGLIGLLLLASFSTYNACVFANSNTLYIKKQTLLAMEAASFDMVKYYAYKALNGMEKARSNFLDCGCEPALTNFDNAEKNLKDATRAKSFEDSKTFLKISLQNTILTLTALKEFEKEYASEYGDDILVMNTKEVLNAQGGILLSPQKKLQQAMDNSLAEFKTSLNEVVKHVECADAFNFINKILAKSDNHLRDPNLTKSQSHYHIQVKAIAREALLQLKGCPVE